MSCLTNIFGEYAKVQIRCAEDEPTIWIYADRDTVSLGLTPEQRQELRAALDNADKLRLAATQESSQ